MKKCLIFVLCFKIDHNQKKQNHIFNDYEILRRKNQYQWNWLNTYLVSDKYQYTQCHTPTADRQKQLR